jgi:hypothetical protein
MDSTYTYEKDGPTVDASLLLRFVTKRLDELVQTDCSKMPVLFKALSLCCVAHDPELNSELNELFFPTTLVKKCRDILGRVTVRPDSQPLDSFRDTPFRGLPDRESRKILFFTMREVKEVIRKNDLEFIPIIKALSWIALQPYPKRLQEFETVWEAGMEPAERLQAVRDVLGTAFGYRDEDDPYQLEEEPSDAQISGKL